MKILILANNDVGLYKFRRELLEELIKEHEVFISLPYGYFIPYMVDMGCKFVECEFDRHGTNPFMELMLIRYYRKIVKVIHPDIVFTYTIKPNVYGGAACANLNVPYVANITGLGTAVENGGLMQRITLGLYKIGLKKAKKVFFQNAENRDFMLRYKVINGRYDLLPGSGVNLNQYNVLEYPNNDIINFVFIARVMKEKGIEQYLDAAEYIKEKYPNTRFIICGECEPEYDRSRMDHLIQSEVIIYKGLVKNVIDIHRISNCTIHPTYYPEGLSNVLLESAACGRPIITTDRSGCREVIDDGLNGFIVNQQDSQDLIRKIEQFLSLSYEERKLMGLRGRDKVEKKFSREIVINQYLNELEDLNKCKNMN